MLSIIEIDENHSFLKSWDLNIELRLSKQVHRFMASSMDKIFLDENFSLKKAIDHKKTLRCFIDIGERHNNDFIVAGSVSFSWNPKRNNCYIGLLWTEPTFRNNGLATYIMNELIHFADDLGVILTLHALPFINPNCKPSNEDILNCKTFYCQFGFREHEKTKEIGSNSYMKRLPQLILP